MDRTTIQLNKSTKDDLEEIKRVNGESFDSVVKLLIANYNKPQDSSELTENRVRELANEQITERVVREAQQ